DKTQTPGFRRESFGFTRCKEKGVQIRFETTLNSGPEDFHRYRVTSMICLDLGAMYLRDRSGCDSRPEACVDRGKRFVESCGDRRLRLALRKRRHLVLQAFQVAGNFCSNHVWTRCEELPELDICGAELGQRGGEPAFAAFRARPLEQSRKGDCCLG